MQMRSSLALACILGGIAACAPGNSDVDDAAPAPEARGMNALTEQERQEGWRLLFDGTSLGGWRGYNQTGMPDGWQAVDGALTRVAAGGDIITRDQFANFELELEWRIREGGNSGIFYRAIESADPIYYSAPEMQILDDARHADGAARLTAAGANYGLHPAPEGVVKPAGEWNAVRLIVNDNHVQHWLNGRMIVEYELGSEDWRQRVAASKFNEWPGYGTAARGHIGLQDHGDWVAFRNIRVKVLP
jgi:hypothetical protein